MQPHDLRRNARSFARRGQLKHRAARKSVGFGGGALALVVFLLGSAAQHATADVVVLANRTRSRVPVRVNPVTARPFDLNLSGGDVVPLFTDGRMHVEFASGGQRKRYLLDANSAYFFGQTRDGRLDLQKIGLGGDSRTAEGRSLPGSSSTAPIGTIPVKILVDEEEPARQAHWERRLRQRVEAASKVLEKYCKLRLKVVAVGTWNSDNATSEFFDSLSEFEREVKPFPARVAIGFTSQYHVHRGRTHLAGTRGPLSSHILIREWSQDVSEPERLELLIHELGHYLGAAHSPEQTSVMRPVLGDRQAVHAEFEIRFDPVNALITAMIGEEIRRRGVQNFTTLSDGSKRRLRQIYGSLSIAFPEDAAAGNFVRITEAATVSPIVVGTKRVLAQIVRAAQTNRKLPASATAAGQQRVRLEGDALTEYYVQQAAAAAEPLPDEVAPTAFLFALGIGLDDSDELRTLAKTKFFVRAVESSGERSVRRALLGDPTLRGRRGLAARFFRSAYLTVVLGTREADSASLDSELLDIQGRPGFSFADVAAGRAGALFATGVLKGRFPLAELASGFKIDQFMPPVDDFQEGLSQAEMAAQYGDQSDPRFQRQLAEIGNRVLQLPPYRPLGAVPQSQ